MKKLIAYISFALLAASAFAKTTGFMLRPNGPLREDKGKGGVEWATTVPEGTELTIEDENPVLLTLITEKERFDNIKFYKVSYDKKTYYARESEVALGKSVTVILSDTTLFSKPAISSFLNAQIEKASLVVAGEKSKTADIDFTEIQYWSGSASEIRKRYVFSEKVSENKKDLEAVRVVDTALALKNKDSEKERAMKQELFKNAKKLNTSDEITEYVQAEYDKIFGRVDLESFLTGKIKSADGSKVNVRKAPVDGEIVAQREKGDEIPDFCARSASKSSYDGITDYWYAYESGEDGLYWIFGGYIEWENDKPIEQEGEMSGSEADGQE